MPLAPRPTTPHGRRIALNIIFGAAIVDAVFLAGLLVAVATGAGGAVTVLGPLYVFGFIYLLYLAATGAMQENWGWGYFALVALTLGPPGALIGAQRMRSEAGAAPEQPPRATRKEQRKAATEERRDKG
jgi:hypothetical protein